MDRRRYSVDLLDEHAARGIASSARAVNEHPRNRAADLRSIRRFVREKREQHPVAAREIGGEYAVHENDRRAHGAGWPAAGLSQLLS